MSNNLGLRTRLALSYVFLYFLIISYDGLIMKPTLAKSNVIFRLMMKPTIAKLGIITLVTKH